MLSCLYAAANITKRKQTSKTSSASVSEVVAAGDLKSDIVDVGGLDAVEEVGLILETYLGSDADAETARHEQRRCQMEAYVAAIARADEGVGRIIIGRSRRGRDRYQLAELVDVGAIHCRFLSSAQPVGIVGSAVDYPSYIAAEIELEAYENREIGREEVVADESVRYRGGFIVGHGERHLIVIEQGVDLASQTDEIVEIQRCAEAYAIARAHIDTQFAYRRKTRCEILGHKRSAYESVDVNVDEAGGAACRDERS